ncbi:MAG: sugar dehydrogenase [Gammaproteobacteria bacterium]|nr:MAG: sugar dehydrogenase [Gammaproteobacteria bacterium]
MVKHKFFLLLIILLPLPLFAGTGSIEIIKQTIQINQKNIEVNVPKDYVLEILTTSLERPRMLAFDEAGNLLIGSRSDNVYRLSPPYTSPTVLIELSDYPHSVDFRQGEILIAQNQGLYRSPYQPGQKTLDEDELQLLAQVPGGFFGHSSRTVRVGPDNKIYLSLGITGNCSDEYIDPSYPKGKRRGGVMVLNESSSGSTWQAYASGLRNPVGFDWHPHTEVMYASNNGPDHLGFEKPPEYFSQLLPGSFHGMPWYQYDGQEVLRDRCIRSNPPRADVTRPVATFPARNAPMAVAFVPDGAMDEKFQGDAIVALHGSWGTLPDGGSSGHPSTRRPPKIVMVRFDNGKPIRVDDLITGFQDETGQRWARPIGAAIGPDGALYFTSDGGEIQGLFRLRKQ